MELTEKNYRGIKYCIKCGSDLDIRNDREGKLRPHCDSCGWIYYRNPVPAAACIVFKDDQLLIIKRKFEPKAGEWALPSGYIELYDTPAETAVTELEEETGLIGESDISLGHYAGNSPLYDRIISFGYIMKVTGGKLQAGDDAAEACYVNINEIPELAFDSHEYFVEEALKIRALHNS